MAKKTKSNYFKRNATALLVALFLLPVLIYAVYQRVYHRSRAWTPNETVMHTAAYPAGSCYQPASTEVDTLKFQNPPIYTIEFWIKPYVTTSTEPQNIIASNYIYNPITKVKYVPAWDIKLVGGKLVAEIRSLRGQYRDYAIVTSSSVLTQSTPKWTHVAIERYNNELRLFINGKQDGSTVLFTQDTSATSLTTGIMIGCQSYTQITTYRPIGSNRYYFRGLLDDLRFSTKIQYSWALYPNGFQVPAFPLDGGANVIALWHFDDQKGSGYLKEAAQYYSFTTRVTGSWNPVLSDIPGAMLLPTPTPIITPTPISSPSATPKPTVTPTPTPTPIGWCPGPNGAYCQYRNCYRHPTCVPSQTIICPDICQLVRGTCQNNKCVTNTLTPTPGNVQRSN